MAEFGGAEMEALGDFFDGEGGFVAEAGGDGKFGAIVSAPGGELFDGPAEAGEFFSNDALGTEDRVFNAKLARCFFCLGFDQVAHLLLESGRAETPAAPYWSE